MISAPTGSGKTLIALAAAVASGEQTTILTHQRALQQQYMEHELVPPLRMATGRANHLCILEDQPEGMTAAHAPCTDGYLCPHSMASDEGHIACPYYRERELAQAAPIRILNYPLFFLQTKFKRFQAGLVICDEGHRLDKAILQNETVGFSRDVQQWLREHKLAVPRALKDGDLLSNHNARVRTWLTAVHTLVTSMAGLKVSEDEQDVLDALKETVKRMWFLLNINATAVYRERSWAFVPVLPEELAPSVLHRALIGHKRLVVMSATIFDAQYVADRLAVPHTSAQYVDLPSTFPVDRRPIFIKPVARMNVESTKDPVVLKALADTIDNIIARYGARKGLIHCGSFALGREIVARSRFRERMHVAEPGDNHLQAFVDSADGIYVSPSAYEGYDFKDDLCRFNIVAKISWPNRGDPVTAQQLKLIPGFNEYEAASALVQAAGRGMRHDEDWCHTYVLDGSVNMLLARVKESLPMWFRAALQWS